MHGRELLGLTAVPEEPGEGSRSSRSSGFRPVLDLLGLSARAGALVFGTNAVRAAVRNAEVHLVVLAADAAEGQRGKLIPLLDARRIPYSIGFTRTELGAATGRSPVSAIGMTNPKLARRARELLSALDFEDE